MPKASFLGLSAAMLLLATLAWGDPVSAQQPSGGRLAAGSDLRVALIISNPVLVKREPDGKLSGISVDIANALGAKLGLTVRVVPYENIVRFNQSIGKDEWDIGFEPRDLSRIAQLAFSDPFIEVDNSYVARPGSGLITPEDVDRPGIRVGVAQGSPTEGYLSRTLKSAQIVRLTGGLVTAEQALSFDRVNVYADYTQIAYLVQAEVPGATVLLQPLNVVRMTIAIPKSNADALTTVNDFIANAKRDGTIANAIKGAGLRGVRVGR
jgi:polar amino acid transport system substrate-binding protein